MRRYRDSMGRLRSVCVFSIRGTFSADSSQVPGRRPSRPRGVSRIVGNGVEPLPIPDEESARIRLIIQSKLPVYPWTYVSVGERVRINEGPLCGLEGIVVRLKDLIGS
jgi:hypothetical protein